jgi:hypothetical protein
MAHQQDKRVTKQLEEERARNDAENRRRFTDQTGLEASQLPGHGRDEPPDTNLQHELGRNLPQQHGGGEEARGRPPRGPRHLRRRHPRQSWQRVMGAPSRAAR